MSLDIDHAAIALIEEHVRRLLSIMGFGEITIVGEMSEEDHLRINIQSSDSGRSLIGTHGATLASLQHVVRCLLRQHITSELRVSVDVNGYRFRREQNLLALAQEVARKAHRTGKSVMLAPMTSADRRAIHTALSDHKDIRTESLGDEPNRRVIIRPLFL